jgi:hypothetical protein
MIKTNTMRFHFCEEPTVVQFIETENRRLFARDSQGAGAREFPGYGVCEEEKSSGDLSPNDVHVLRTNELYA